MKLKLKNIIATNFPFILKVRNEFIYIINNIKWRNRNKHNTTTIRAKNINEIKVGKHTYGEINVHQQYGLPNEYLEIGSYCSIGPNVKFLLAGEHNYKHFSTFPFKVKLQSLDVEAVTKGQIIIEDDVWIGYGTVILSGVKIGKGSVIGANSLIAKNIEPYSIVVGNPSKVIKKRFSEEVITELLKIDFNSINFLDILHENSELLYEEFEISKIRKIKEFM